MRNKKKKSKLLRTRKSNYARGLTLKMFVLLLLKTSDTSEFKPQFLAEETELTTNVGIKQC